MMHDGSEKKEERCPAVFATSTAEADDVGLRGAWIAAAEQIAAVEREVSTWLLLRRSAGQKRSDELRPGFLYLGEGEALGFIAAMVVGILTYGEPFIYWVQSGGADPRAPAEFEKVFLGSWPSAERFTQYLLDQRARDDDAADSEESEDEWALDAANWAADLQRRGEIRVVDDPEGGVWIFRGW
jgi:hypothetical protein